MLYVFTVLQFTLILFICCRSMSCEEKDYLDSCKQMVEVHHDIMELSDTAEDSGTLDEVNGQLLISKML